MQRILFTTACFSIITQTTFAQNPLIIPPLLVGDTFDLNLQMGTQEFYPGIQTPTYGVNGPILGPTLLMDKGDWVRINVTNQLNSSTTIHWHGLHVPAMMDGGPHQNIPIGTTWSPEFEVMNDAATYWYHPHGEGKTDLHVSKGIAGLIIVRDSAEQALDLPRTYGVDDIPLVLQTKAFDELQQIAIATWLDSVVVVNATQQAYQEMPAQVVRLRVLNGASARSFNLGFNNGMDFYQIAGDASLLDAPVLMNRLLLSPGERAELLVDLAALQGDTVALMNYGSGIPNNTIGAATVQTGMGNTLPDYALNPLNGADFPLVQFYVGAPTADPVTTIPTALVTHTPWLEADVDVQRSLFFEPEVMNSTTMLEGPFMIGGAMFDMHVINITAQLNDIEIWTLSNQTALSHPFHLHDVPFYILDINGVPPAANQRGKKDVVLVPRMQTVRFITKFEDFADPDMAYMYHCHLLHHEDDGMMGQFVVVDPNTAVETLETADIRLYPNPVDDHLVLEHLSGELRSVAVYDAWGRLVYRAELSGVQAQVELPKGSAGMYVVEVQHSGGVWREKIIRE